MNQENSRVYLVDTQQTYWQLAVIQLAGWMTLPILATSILILQSNSFLGAALTIIVGNAILWFVRLGIISMSFKKRQSILDLSEEYFGKVGGYFIAVLLLVSTFAWFIVQTTTASKALTHLVSLHESVNIDQFIQISVFLGVASTFLCMEGMILLRYLSTVAFPLLALAFILVLFSMPHGSYSNGNPLSLSGLTLVLATNLGITSDMPTFFRHSRSWVDSIKALTIVQVISIALGLASLLLGGIINDLLKANEYLNLNGNELLRYSFAAFIFISAVCTNVGNVYSSSVGWELIAPRALIGRKEYLILGLSLTTIFILVSNVFTPTYLLDASDFALVNLCIVCVLAYLLTRAYKKPPTPYQQKTYFIAWLIPTGVNAIEFAYGDHASLSPLLLSFSIILAVIFLGYFSGRFFEKRKAHK